MKSNLVKAAIAIASVAFVLACQDTGSGVVRPDGVGPQFAKKDCKNDPNSCWRKPGGDFAPIVNAKQTIGGVGEYTWASNSRMVIDAHDWYKNPKTNYGWVLISDEKKLTTAIQFDSRENPSAKHRPQLVVEYILPAAN